MKRGLGCSLPCTIDCGIRRLRGRWIRECGRSRLWLRLRFHESPGERASAGTFLVGIAPVWGSWRSGCAVSRGRCAGHGGARRRGGGRCRGSGPRSAAGQSEPRLSWTPVLLPPPARPGRSGRRRAGCRGRCRGSGGASRGPVRLRDSAQTSPGTEHCGWTAVGFGAGLAVPAFHGAAFGGTSPRPLHDTQAGVARSPSCLRAPWRGPGRRASHRTRERMSGFPASWHAPLRSPRPRCRRRTR